MLGLALWAGGCKPDNDDNAGSAGSTPTTESSTKTDGRSDTEVKLPPEAVSRAGIRVETADRHDLGPTFMAPGRVGFNSEAITHVGSPVKGQVKEIKVKRGDTVAKDAELLVIESTELGETQREYLSRKAAVKNAESLVSPAQEAFERARERLKNEQVTVAEVQKRLAEFRTAQAAVESAKSGVAAMETRLRVLGQNQQALDELMRTGEVNPRFKVRAPIAGQVMERNVAAGEMVTPERDSLLVLGDTATVYVLADVPEDKMAELRKGARMRVRIAAAGGLPERGTVSFISGALTASTRSVEVRTEVDNSQGKLRPGMLAEIEIGEQGERKSVIAVPDVALQSIDGRACVFVPGREEGTYLRREVKVGRATGDWVEILSGIKEGERLVTTGAAALKMELVKPVKEDEE